MSEAAKLAYGIKEAAKALDVSERSVWRLIRAGELSTFTWCGRTLILAEVLQAAVRRAAGREAA